MLRFFLKVFWSWDMYLSSLGKIRSRSTLDNIFCMLLSRVMGLVFDASLFFLGLYDGN